MVEYVNIKNAGNPNAYNRKPFTKAEVSRIWKVKDTNIYYTIILMLLYSGCRISELLDLKKDYKLFYLKVSVYGFCYALPSVPYDFFNNLIGYASTGKHTNR